MFQCPKNLQQRSSRSRSSSSAQSPRPRSSSPSPQVLYSKFGFMYQDLKLGDDEFILIREEDVIGVMPR